MTDAKIIADAIDRNTKAIEGLHDSIAILSNLFESSLTGGVNQVWAVDAIVSAIRKEPPPKS